MMADVEVLLSITLDLTLSAVILVELMQIILSMCLLSEAQCLPLEADETL